MKKLLSMLLCLTLILSLCLSCTAETCDGKADCYRRRKKQLDQQRRKQYENEICENPA